MEGTFSVPGTEVKFPKWALLALVGGIVAVLILRPKGQEQGDFNEEGVYTDDSAGGAWELISEIIDTLQGMGLPGIEDDLTPITDSPKSQVSYVEDEVTVVAGSNSPWTHEERPFFVNPAGFLDFVVGGAYDVPTEPDNYIPPTSQPGTGSITDYYADSHEDYWAGYTEPKSDPVDSSYDVQSIQSSYVAPDPVPTQSPVVEAQGRQPRGLLAGLQEF